MQNNTVGAIASDLLSKHNQSLNPQEIQRAQEEEYLRNLEWAVKHATKQTECSTIKGHEGCVSREAMKGSFFVAVLLKKEKLLENVLRNYFIPTKSCPTPTYDQTLYRYDHEKDSIEFLWVIPDTETAAIFRENVNKIVHQERVLLQCILDFDSGRYYRMMKKFNGESDYAGNSLVSNVH